MYVLAGLGGVVVITVGIVGSSKKERAKKRAWTTHENTLEGWRIMDTV